MLKNYIFGLFLCFLVFPVMGQALFQRTEVNFTTFDKPVLSDPVMTAKVNGDKLKNHPNYGVLPEDAPCENCTEVLEKRTAKTRHYIDNETNGTLFYNQHAYEVFNYKDENGFWKELSYKLKQTSTPNVFKAPDQPYPIEVDMNEGLISSYDDEYVLKMKDAGMVNGSHINASLAQYTAGSDGVSINNIFGENITKEIILYRGEYETNYIIKTKPEISGEYLIFKEQIILPEGLSFDLSGAHKQDDGTFTGHINIVDSEGKDRFTIHEAFAYDNSTDKQYIELAYLLNEEKGILSILVPKSWLNSSDILYPVIVDPTVTTMNTLALASITGSGYASATCQPPAGSTGYCSYTMTVPTPAFAVIPDIIADFSYSAQGACVFENGALKYLVGNCVSPPAGYWWCPGLTQGTCNGTGISIYSHVQSCILPPQCASYDLNFEMRIYRCQNGPTNGCDNTCIRPLTPWTVTIQGRTVENTSITSSQTICEGNNVTLTTAGNYGVGPRTVQWSPGGSTGNSITVSPTATTTYTATVTDACGQTATASTTITVIQNANPGFTISPNPACVGETVTITGNGGNPVNNYDWNIPNSSQPNVTNTNPVTVTYVGTGTNNITLNYQNGICVFPSTQTIDITAGNTASVSITANPAGTICAGTPVTFTATPTNGGPTPTYQWKVNGNNVGSGGTTYTGNSLNDGDVVTVVMTTSASCTSPPTSTSNQITMDIDAAVTPDVNVTANPSGPICSGTNVDFTAVPVSGSGLSPSFQWQVNGNNAGTGLTFSSNSLANGDVVTVIMTSSSTCASPTTATSPPVNMTVNTSLTPSVTIADNPSGSICAGTTVVFTVTPTNGGSSPTYQWFLNGTNVTGGSTTSFPAQNLSDGDMVWATMTSSDPCASPTTATSNTITVNVVSSVTPDVTIQASPTGPICTGDAVTFTASPSGGGTAPTYQWKVNGNNVGSGGTTFTSSTLADNDVVTVVMASNDACASPTTATSNQITMSVNSAVTPSVGISANPASPICAGTSVTFTATPTNGGSGPTYQWQVNGNNVGSGGTTYTTTNLVNNDVVTAIMTSDAACASPTTATSNQVNITVTPSVTPSVSIAANPNTPVCAGTPITFTATPTNGGNTPTYQWQVNGTNAGNGGATFTSSTLANGDAVTVIMTSNANCAVPATATSNAVNVTIDPSVTPSVNITAVPNGPICTGDQVDFTATPTNGGNNPTYQWMVNGNNAGAGGTTFSSTTLNDGDVVTVELTSDAVCANPTTATSNQVTISVSNPANPSVSVAVVPNGPICQGDQVDFTANPTDGGSSPTYQWQVNGSNVGTNSNTFSSGTLINGDVVTVIMTTSIGCTNQPTATSAPINMTVNPTVTPSVTLSANPSTAICYGTQVDFTTNPQNGGNNPTYEWFVNGVSSGAGATFSSTSLNNNDQVTVELTSDEVCASPTTAISGPFIMQVNPAFNPTISIAVAPGNDICSGDQVTFTATPSDAGANPDYQWMVNGSNVGTNSNTFSSPTLNDGDVVTVELTSNEACANPTTATSNTITMTVGQFVAPTVSIVADPSGQVCSGVSVTFTATPTGGGSSPGYQWLLNGNAVGTSNATYTNNSLNDGDVVEVVLTSSNPCATPQQATSNQIVIQGLDPITITTSGDTTLCNSEPVNLTVVASGGDGNYYYVWSINGIEGDDVIVTPSQSTTYTVVVGDSCGSTPATGSFDVIVEGPPTVTFDAVPSVTTILDPTIEFENTSDDGMVVVWDFGDSTNSVEENPVHIYQDTGVFTVKLIVMSQGGCIDSLSYEVVVNEIFAFYIPNAFTPTGDLLNDVFEVKGLMQEDYEMHIFNRWGAKVFETHTSEPWNGRVMNTGEIVPQGTYSYYIRFDTQEYKFKPVTGIVHLIK